jgi:hypothetical protein
MDLDGYFLTGGTSSSPSGNSFVPVSDRLYNSSDPDSTALDGGQTLIVPIANAADDLPTPESMVAAAVVVSVSNTTASGGITVYSSWDAQPNTTDLSYTSDDNVSALTVSPTSADGSIAIYNSGSQSVEITVDAVGYFSASGVAFSDVPGSTHAFMHYNDKTSLLFAHGSMTGWKRGKLTVWATVYLDGEQVGFKQHTCSSSTSCETPALIYPCPVSGTWSIYVQAFRNDIEVGEADKEVVIA